MRTKNSILNFLANEGSHFWNILLSFLCRTVFIYTMSKEYLGMTGLFTNVLTVLSLAELGIGTAMMFHMYKPVNEHDHVLLNQLMNLYRRFYNLVALFILVVGFSLMPALQFFIKDTVVTNEIRIVYGLYLINTAASYILGYRCAIINAHQKGYVVTALNTVATTVQFLTQMLVLWLTHNFILYLSIQIICNIATNAVVAVKAGKMYPYIDEDKKTLPPVEVRHHIYKNVGATFLHKLGDVVINNTDDILMSKFFGLVTEGIYSNYQLIQFSINTALNGLFGAFTAGIGDLGAENDKKKIYSIYKTMNFMGFWMYSFSTIAFLVMFNPFISVWAGEDFIFPMYIVVVYEMAFYVSGMRKITLTFRDALGLYWYDRYKPLAEVIVDIAASLICIWKFGVVGVVMGPLISSVGICLWIEPLVTFKYGFEVPLREYFKKFFIYTLTTVVVGGFTYWVTSFADMGGVTEIVIKLLLVIVIYNAIVFVLYWHTPECQDLYRRGMNVLRIMKEKKEDKGA